MFMAWSPQRLRDWHTSEHCHNRIVNRTGAPRNPEMASKHHTRGVLEHWRHHCSHRKSLGFQGNASLLAVPCGKTKKQKTKTANAWQLESAMCQAVKPHPCGTCVSLSLQAFGCEREALSRLEREEVLIYFGISERSSMAPQPFALE